MHMSLTSVPGSERYTIHPNRIVSYNWQSACGTQVFDTVAYNLEAARSKLQRHLAGQNLLPVLRQTG